MPDRTPASHTVVVTRDAACADDLATARALLARLRAQIDEIPFGNLSNPEECDALERVIERAAATPARPSAGAEQVLAALRTHGPTSGAELAGRLGRRSTQVGSHLASLARRGLIDRDEAGCWIAVDVPSRCRTCGLTADAVREVQDVHDVFSRHGTIFSVGAQALSTSSQHRELGVQVHAECDAFDALVAAGLVHAESQDVNGTLRYAHGRRPSGVLVQVFAGRRAAAEAVAA